MLEWITLKIAAWGLSGRAARLLAYGGAILAALAFLGLAKAIYDHRLIAAHEARQQAAGAKARAQATEEQIRDDAANARSEEELHNAIDTAPRSAAISPAAHALACERLRRIGRIPEACRPARRDGSQAATD